MKHIITSSLLLLTTFTQAQDTIYFDNNWKATTKEKHSFYRPLPLKKLGDVFLLRDFYKNGNLQMQGYIQDKNNENSYIGDIFWYKENGLDENQVKYYNNSTTKELIYYFSDNTIWKKVNYNKSGEKDKIEVFYKNKLLYTGFINGKNQYQGTFSQSMQDNYYQKNQIDVQLEAIDTITTINTIAPPLVQYGGGPEKPKIKEVYKTVVYWINGKKAEAIVYGIDEYYRHQKLKKTVWNEKGNLLFSLDLQDDNKQMDYSEFTYYTINDFVKSVNSEKVYKNGLLTEIKLYTIDNQLKQIEKYKNRLLIEKDNIIENSKSYYKDGKPWDGKFEETIAQKSFNFQLQNGKKINKEIVKDLKSNAVLYEGEYKNGEPWNGSFFTNKNNLIELSHYKDGKKDGLQKKFQNYYDDLIEEYEMKDGIREGFRKQYKNEKLINESFYKKNHIVNGAIADNNGKSVYTDGKLVEKIYFSNYSDEIKRKESYINNEISTIKYYNFSIKNDEKEFYQGIYKNKQPYEGYFLNDSLISDFPLVDFYQNGQLKYQYSFDFLKQLNNYEHYTYDIKSTFKNGKIVDGSQYKMIDNSSLLSEKYKNSSLISFDLNLFAMHYFNRISFVLKGDEIIVSELESPLIIKLKYDNKNTLQANVYDKDKLVYSNTSTNTAKEGSPNSMTIYYLEKNTLKKYHFNPTQLDNEVYRENHLLFKILNSLPTKIENSKNKLESILQRIEGLTTNNFNQNSDESNLNFPFSEKDIITYLNYSSNGEKQYGLFIHENSDKSFDIDVYREGKKTSSQHVNSLEELLSNNQKIIRELSNTVDIY